ncbi:transmembrane channel-like protein 7 [Cloeon dipterum]|uniref:transmembrane channel-like protein 7 n=1 Tax=Cloeon dipterum TaxID=197152 RepID=UPI0032206A53
MSSGDGSGWESYRMQAWQQVRYRDNHPEATASTSNAASIDAGAHRDAAAHLATLLPSKQAQHTIGEVALNWLLSSENIPNEERAWEEIMRIKEMPVNMAQKKELKAQFKNANHGFEEVKWQRKKFWQRCKANFKDFFGKLELWQGSLKTIEGNFGVGVVSLFLFIKWLMFLNIFIFTLTFLLIVLPSAILEPGPSGQCDLAGNDSQSIACCVEQYQNYTSTSSDFFFFDLVQGTGWMEKTMLFYGHYTSEIYTLNNGLFYDLPFAYLISTLLYFLVSLIAIVKSAARGFRERIITGESQFYCNLIFAGWDFCFDKPKRMIYVQKAIFNEIKGCLEAERLQTERKIPTRKEKFRLLLSRVVVNTGIISILLASMVAIYYVFTLSRQLLRTYENSESRMLLLFFEFMPYLLIVSLNLLLPLLFTFLVDFEHYSPIVVVRITLLRTVFLRLSTLGVLGASIYPIVSCYRHDGCVCRDEAPLCWETYVGQQFYKLAMTNALSGIAVTFFINFPRAMIARYFEGNRFISFVCEQQFELPGHALDVVYSQTLCWIGSFYSPLLPAFAVVHCFLTFYVKKFACLVNSRPPSQIYRTSRSNYMFISVLLISFVAAAIAVGYSLTEVKPSRSCGPFKGDDPVWVTLWLSFNKLPSWIQGFASFLSTAGFTLPMIVLLLLALYYFNSVTAARRQMALVLRRQLLLEGQDKQFLLDQLNVIIEEQKHRQNTSSWNARYPQNLSFCSRRRTMKI